MKTPINLDEFTRDVADGAEPQIARMLRACYVAGFVGALTSTEVDQPITTLDRLALIQEGEWLANEIREGRL